MGSKTSFSKLARANIAVALISLSLVLLFIPLLFSLIDPTRDIELIVFTTIGCVFSYGLILATCLSIANYPGSKLLAIFINWRWVPILLGTSALYALASKLSQKDLPNSIPFIALLLFMTMLLALYLVSNARDNLNKRVNQQADSVADDTDNLPDLDRLFNPETSDATTLLHISKLEDNRELSGHLLEEYLINQGCRFEIISQEITGDSVIKINDGDHVAYVKSLNLSIRQFQQYAQTKNIEHLPPDAMQWDILIAVIDDSPTLQTKIEFAIKELVQHHQTKFARMFDVCEYQQLGRLCDFNKGLAQAPNQVRSIGHYRGTLEITLEIFFQDGKNINMYFCESIWRSAKGILGSECMAINEDATASTPDVELTYFSLPYPQCQLIALNVFGEGVAPNILYLTFVRIENGELTTDETTLTAELCDSTVVFGNDTAHPGKVICFEQYLAKYCIKYLT